MNQRYVLPDICNGPYFVTLDGEPVWQGFDEGSGWHYDEFGRMFWLDDTIIVADGTANLRVYFYTTQVLENVLADILAGVGLYGTRALALADMDYDATNIEIPRVWFDALSAAMDAVATICERANYRFWFGYDGKPHFRPAPIADSLEFTFTASDHLKDLSEFQDRANLRNRIIIEGIQQAMYPLSNEDKTNSRLKGEAFDAPSILAYLEHSYSIQNHLFQDQTSVDTMAVELRDDFKNPVWCSDLSLFANPVPLEIGDVIEWPLELEPLDADPGSLSGSESGGITINLLGIIRDIKINDSGVNYKVEVVSGLTGAIAHAGAIPSEETFGAAEVRGLIEEIFEYGDGDFTVPAGVTELESIEAWGVGGWGADGQAGSGGGGGGGGAYARINNVPVTPLETLALDIGDADSNPNDTTVTQDVTDLILRAAMGNAASGASGGAGGLAGDCLGDEKRGGGNGVSVGGFIYGGGGGGSGAPGQTGRNGSTIWGGVAWPDGGEGAMGGSQGDSAPAVPGNHEPGGGGGGGGQENPDPTSPSKGARGRVRISYFP
jgi:hypothetical protein